jgi:hypothetical protein
LTLIVRRSVWAPGLPGRSEGKKSVAVAESRTTAIETVANLHVDCGILTAIEDLVYRVLTMAYDTIIGVLDMTLVQD